MASRTYLLVVLTLLSALNHVDRQLIAILLEPIRHEFALSDVELGLLSGFAFAVLFASLSIPAAVWAVHHSRRNLIAAAAALWGAMTAACGLAQSFWQLLAGRIGIGIGEAGAMPASHGMISDVYPPHQRATAMATWAAGINIGVFLAFLIGGYVAQRFGWRAAFVVSGIATCAAALLVRLTVTEPPRAPDADGDRLRAAPSFALIGITVRMMWNDAVLRHTTIAATVTATVGYGAIAWMASFLARTHQIGIAARGAYLAVVIGLGGAVAALIGGRLTDVLRKRDIRWSLWLVGIAIMLSKPLSLTFYLADTTVVALTAFAVAGLASTVYIGPSLAVLHNSVPPTLRPTASAAFLTTVNLIGLGLGPLLVGMMSQWLFAANGDHSLRYALAVTQVIGLLGAAHFLVAGQRLRSPGNR